MARTWTEIEESKEYNELSQKGKMALKRRYFDEVITSKDEYNELSDGGKSQLRARFFAKPSLYKAFNAEITPEDEKNSPYLSAIAKTAQEGIATPVAHFANQALLNLPRAVAENLGYDYPEPETAPGTILSKGAGIVGLAYGLGPKIFQKTGP